MCVVTGRHMVLDDWCFCPVSKCPALYSEYIKYIEVRLCVYVHVCVCFYVCMYVCMYVHGCVCACVSMCMCVCMCVCFSHFYNVSLSTSGPV